MTRVRVLDPFRCVGLVESVAVAFTVAAPADVGVPLMTPAALIVRPAGRAVAVQVYGAVPPLAARVALYDVPTTPRDNADVVTVTGLRTTREKVLVAVRCVGFVESVAVATTVLVPPTVGVPLITPVDVFNVSPAGRPDADQV